MCCLWWWAWEHMDIYSIFSCRSRPGTSYSWDRKKPGRSYQGRGFAEIGWPVYSKEHSPWSWGGSHHYVRAPGIYHSDPCVERLRHMSFADCAIHFWEKGLPGSEMLEHVDYNAQQDMVSGHSSFTNTVNNIWSLSPDEIVQGNDHAELWTKPMVGPAQEIIALMNNWCARLRNRDSLFWIYSAGPFNFQSVFFN